MSLLTLCTSTAPGFTPTPLPETTRLVCFPGKILALLSCATPLTHHVVSPPNGPSRVSMTFFVRPSPFTRFTDPGTGEEITAHKMCHIMNDVPKGWGPDTVVRCNEP
eukprot:TRINITY_DN12182_c0_g1_i1.p1 TRINITY_DN12182_c0_g1~~TRINITY_DN12182_c0_g1_i1.p1  ORF type:complete len:107 (+),score=1.50 TRINITY_DN12182_c0_g1_i1:193-513(+)